MEMPPFTPPRRRRYFVVSPDILVVNAVMTFDETDDAAQISHLVETFFEAIEKVTEPLGEIFFAVSGQQHNYCRVPVPPGRPLT